MVPRPHKDPQVRCPVPQEGHARESTEADRCPFYLLKSGQALTATHMKIKKQEGDQCRWCLRSKDPGALIQALLHMAIPAKRDVGPGGKGDQAPQAKVENGRALRRREVQRADLRVLTHACREDGPPPPGRTRGARRRQRSQSAPGMTVGVTRDDRRGGRGFWEKGICTTASGFLVEYVQRGTRGLSRGTRHSFSFIFLTSLSLFNQERKSQGPS